MCRILPQNDKCPAKVLPKGGPKGGRQSTGPQTFQLSVACSLEVHFSRTFPDGFRRVLWLSTNSQPLLRYLGSFTGSGSSKRWPPAIAALPGSELRLAVGFAPYSRFTRHQGSSMQVCGDFLKPSQRAHNASGRRRRSACSKQRHSEGDHTAQVLRSTLRPSGLGSTARF
jgi:hypothetical protein